MTARALIDDPGYLAYSFDFEKEHVAFLPVEPEEVREASALKRETIDPGRVSVDVPLADVARHVESPDEVIGERSPNFVFHTAYCASTFLSRCLDVDRFSVALREPQILLDAANAKRLQWRSTTTNLDFRALPRLFLALLQKHAPGREKLLIKPINSVNNIIPELLLPGGIGKSLMMYTDARNFVLSTLRKGEGGKQTTRSMFDLLRCDFPHLANLQLTHVLHMTDLRIAMTLWRLHLEQAEHALRQFAPSGILASLYGERVIRDLPGTLQSVSNFLELGISPDQVDAIARSADRSVDAKDSNETFSLEKREERYRQLESVYGKDLDDGLEWLVRNNPGTRLVPELSAPLPE